MKRPDETPWPDGAIGPEEYAALPPHTPVRDHLGNRHTSQPGIIPSGWFPMTIERQKR